MAANHPERDQATALLGLNRAFLALLLAASPGQSAFGLEPAVLQKLRGLPGDAQDALAMAPVLLAGCRVPPGQVSGAGVAEAPPLRPGHEPPCQVFAAALLTWLWHVSRSDPLAAALHTGPTAALADWLREAGYSDIERASARAPVWLEARFAANPRVWPDLVRAASQRDDDLLAVTRLSFVQLALVAPRALPRPAAGRPP